jgi:hypothetical protein
LKVTFEAGINFGSASIALCRTPSEFRKWTDLTLRKTVTRFGGWFCLFESKLNAPCKKETVASQKPLPACLIEHTRTRGEGSSIARVTLVQSSRRLRQQRRAAEDAGDRALSCPQRVTGEASVGPLRPTEAGTPCAHNSARDVWRCMGGARARARATNPMMLNECLIVALSRCFGTARCSPGDPLCIQVLSPAPAGRARDFH